MQDFHEESISKDGVLHTLDLAYFLCYEWRNESVKDETHSLLERTIHRESSKGKETFFVLKYERK